MSAVVTAIWVAVGLVIAVTLMWIVDELHKRNKIVSGFPLLLAGLDRKLDTISQNVNGALAEQQRQVAQLKAQLSKAGLIPDTEPPDDGP